MFQELIISKDLSLNKFLKGMVTNGFNGKISQIAEQVTTHRRSIGRFISTYSWDENLLTNAMKKSLINTMQQRAKESKKPVYFIIDDTISKKTKPSSKAKNPIENCKFAFSHLECKKVYGHQIIVSLLSCDGLTLSYSIDIYDKETMSKIKLAQTLINGLTKKFDDFIVLADSWYSSKTIFDVTYIEDKQNYIGAIKTNRVIYPEGCRKLGIKVHSFAKSLPLESFDLVTVRNKKYYVYKYVSDLNDRKNIVIVLSYPKDALYENSALKAFISLDSTVPISEILNHYNFRWDIEPFFKDCKAKLGLNGYQIRKLKAIKRYLLIMLLSYTYFKLHSKFLNNFAIGFKKVKKTLEKEKIKFIVNAVKKGLPLPEIFKLLNVA